MIKEARQISGVFFRFQNPDTGKWETRVFEDLPESEQDRVMEGREVGWIKSIAKIMANRLYEICEQFDITAVNHTTNE